LQLAFQNILRWKNRQVLRDVYPGRVQLQEFNLLGAGSRAEDDAQRRSFVLFPLVLGQPPEVEFHLALVLCPETSLLQIDGHQPLELPVVEQEVDVEVFSIELNALLACHEGETGTEFQQKQLQLAQDGVFKIPFQIVVFEVEEVQDIGIFENQRRADLSAAVQLSRCTKIPE
jgi:hypothetical protein